MCLADKVIEHFFFSLFGVFEPEKLFPIGFISFPYHQYWYWIRSIVDRVISPTLSRNPYPPHEEIRQWNKKGILGMHTEYKHLLI